jgi:V8-like Glu-specific endopeptidase
VLKNADATVALIEAGNLQTQPDGSSNLVGTSFAEAYELCPTERFTRQPTCAFCSGVLVAPDIVATAGHCVADESIPPESIRIVFDFRMKNSDTAILSAPADNVYKVVEVLDAQLTLAPDRDWALVRLDRPVVNRQPAKMRASGEIRKDETVYVIGHPCGLPQKYAGGSAILNNDAEHFFSANLDTYGGNSGSPVFNKQSNQVEGLLVRGANDFIPFNYNGRLCFRSEIWPTTGTQGEDVSRVSDFRQSFEASVNKRKKANSSSDTPAKVQ